MASVGPSVETSAGTEGDRSHSIPSSGTAGRGATEIIKYKYMHALIPFYFVSFNTQCSAISEFTSLWGSAPSTPVSHWHIFSWSGIIDLLSISVAAYSNSLKLMSSVRKPGNLMRQTAKVPSNSHSTIPGVTLGGRNAQHPPSLVHLIRAETPFQGSI